MDLSAIIDEFNRRKAQAGQRISDMFTPPKKPDDWFQQMQQGQNAVVTPEQRDDITKAFEDALQRMNEGLVPPMIRERERAMRTDPSAAAKPFTSQEVKQATPFVTAAAPIAYHGTPHTFDKFDASKIGTGQGAQSYGHGLYFAENPQVANTYQDAGQTMSMAAKRGGGYQLMKNDVAVPGKVYQTLDEANAAMKEFKGNMYQVNIPDQHAARMLDWDKPLSEQPHLPKELVDEVIYQLQKPANEITGEKFYQILAARRGNYNQSTGGRIEPQAASKLLADAGIPGIKYLDQGSRAITSIDPIKQNIAERTAKLAEWQNTSHPAAQQQRLTLEREIKQLQNELKYAQDLKPTSNYVVFDPAILEDVARK